MCQLNECAQPSCQCFPLQTSEMVDSHVHFIRSMAQTPRSEPTELYNLHKKISSGSFSEKFITWTDRHYGMAVMALSNASSITLHTSGVNVSECVFMQKNDFLSIQFDCRLSICIF